MGAVGPEIKGRKTAYADGGNTVKAGSVPRGIVPFMEGSD